MADDALDGLMAAWNRNLPKPAPSRHAPAAATTPAARGTLTSQQPPCSLAQCRLGSGRCAARCGTSAAPCGTSAAPYGTSAAIYGTSAAPCGTSAAPCGSAAAPCGSTAASWSSTAASCGSAAAPPRRATLPHERPAAAPHRKAAAAAAAAAAVPPAACPRTLSAAPAGPCVEHGFFGDQNRQYRKYMEDEHVAHTLRPSRFRVGRLFALYDGHGGRDAVDFVVTHLHQILEAKLCEIERVEVDAEVGNAFSTAFRKVDRMLAQTGCFLCGTTAVVCFVAVGAAGTPPVLHVANVGDSRALLISDGGVQRLTVDHLATDDLEALRVQREGGKIIGRRVGGTLALTRALGDHAVKGPGGGVIAEPHFATRRLSHTDRFLLLASDGVWDVVNEEDARELLLSCASEPAEAMSMRLVQLALERGTKDNVSALVVRLQV
ncbi:hypothetical protein AB1Y20_006284 [Prymnesium parvum]|uniref:PPM-type phosphatase domain-containing protein n=1 Tax=Prymnesium parvum TaxID=97485 RepID=A0AB34J2U2_PRYPA